MALRIVRDGAARTKPDAAKKEKLPPLVHVVCGWPLILVAVGGAIGGGLGGVAYGLAITFYKRTRSLPQTLAVSVVLGAAAVLGWYLIVRAIRS